MTPMMTAIAALTAVCILALLGLMYVYYRNLRQVKSKFTIGLMIFAALFLLQNIVSLYFYFTMMEYYVPAVEMHVFILTLLQAIGFLVMLKITWE
jgi:hypothetical protein